MKYPLQEPFVLRRVCLPFDTHLLSLTTKSLYTSNLKQKLRKPATVCSETAAALRGEVLSISTIQENINRILMLMLRLKLALVLTNIIHIIATANINTSASRNTGNNGDTNIQVYIHTDVDTNYENQYEF